MKILVVSQYYYPEPFRITDICEQLSLMGHNVTILTGIPNYPEGVLLKEYKEKSRQDEVRNGVRIIRCKQIARGSNAISLLLNYFSYAINGVIKAKKLKEDYDAVFVNQLSPVMMAWPAIAYAKKHKKKVLLYCYDLWPASLSAGGIKQGSLIYKLFGKISKSIYKKVSRILVTSESFKDYLIKEHDIESDKINYLPQYCENIYSSIPQKPFDKDNINLVFAGNVGQMQSVETILKAAKELKEDTSIKFHIIGDGRDYDNCLALSQKEKLANVMFYGRKPIEDMPIYYSIADAMLVTLAKDKLVSKTLPGKIQSYMCAGKPIIASIDGEAQRVIAEAKCGYVSEAENAALLVDNIKRFKDSDVEAMQQNSKNYYIEHFSKEKFFISFEKYLEDISNGN